MSPGVWFHASLVPKKRRGRSALDEQKPCGFGAIASQPRGNHLLLQDLTRNRGKELEEIQEYAPTSIHQISAQPSSFRRSFADRLIGNPMHRPNAKQSF
ncbi:hypothetical protein Ddc_08282 [Ditylenchus destructor]|nr:hypothetical protein Ddc_08282 [Ditylenchus destructor]